MNHGYLRFILGFFILIGIIVAVSAHLQKEVPAVQCLRCNVILISIDALGAKHTSLADSSVTTTPFLSAVADEEGIVFENSYAQAPWTLPSHTALFTGEYPWSLHIWKAADQLPESATTIAEVLRNRGYETVAFSNGFFVNPEWNTMQGFITFHGSLEESAWNDTPSIFDGTISWLEKERDQSKPFFVLIHSFGVHDPYGDLGTNANSIHIDEIVAENLKDGGPSEEATDRFQTAYHNDIRETDRALEKLFLALKEQKLLENTIIVVTSDHGEEFGEHGTAGFHSITTYRENLHVPLVFFIPKEKPKRVASSIEVRSIPATILDMLGSTLASEIGGLSRSNSLVPLMVGDSENRLVLSATYLKRETLLPYLKNNYPSIRDFRKEIKINTQGIQTPQTFTASALLGRWHVIKQPGGAVEVYDMEHDPQEQENLASTVNTLPYAEYAIINELKLALLHIK